MAKKRKKITAVGEWLENYLRQWCGRVPAGRRIAVILSLLFLFVGLSLYITFSSLFNLRKNERERLNFRHIEGLRLELKGKPDKADSLKTINEFHYEKKRE